MPVKFICAVIVVSATTACGSDASGISGPAIVARDSAAPVAPAPVQMNALVGSQFWIDPSSNARVTATAWRTSRPLDATQMDKIASQAVAKWFTNTNTNIQADVNNAMSLMRADGSTPVLVAYNISQRDCGSGMSAGSTSPSAYREWITAFATGIGSRKAAVILEPDALAEMDCLSAADQQTRLDLMSFAVQTLTSRSSAVVYIDAGNPRWTSAAVMAKRLATAGIAQAQGFSLNVASFLSTSDNVAFGTQLSSLVSGKHFIVDTGRNGLGPSADAQWCNPAGRAIGNRPTAETGNALVDAFLWIKAPGESDGTCNGGAGAGQWMPEYALGLAQRG